MTNTTEAFADYLIEKSGEIGPAVLDMADQCRQDYAAVAAAGAARNRRRWETLVGRLPEGNAVLYGHEKRVDSRMAALVNGFNAHCLELDDGQRFAMIHLGASIVAAVDAAGADFSFSDRDRLTGIVMGYEAACRTGIAMQPSHKKRGYHAAGTCGTIGAAMAVAFALGYGKNQLKRVLSLAAGSSAGMLEIQEQRSEIKPYNLGRAAMDGMTAAYLGMTDFEVPDDMLGGERGFFHMFSDSWSLEKLVETRESFEIQRIYVKPYASCRHSHSAVEAALRLRSRIDPARIRSVVVKTYQLAVKGHDHTQIAGTASAKLSTPYAVAVALLYGRADLSAFEPVDRAAVRLAARIEVSEDGELTAQSPQKRIAVVCVTMEDGSTETERVDYAKGDPENPMTAEELREKWESLSEYAKSRK